MVESFQKEKLQNKTMRFLYFQVNVFSGTDKLFYCCLGGAKGAGNCFCTKNRLLCGRMWWGIGTRGWDTEYEIEASGVITCRVGHVYFYSFL